MKRAYARTRAYALCEVKKNQKNEKNLLTKHFACNRINKAANFDANIFKKMKKV